MQFVAAIHRNFQCNVAVKLKKKKKKNRCEFASSFDQVRNPCDIAATTCTKIVLKSHVVYRNDFQVVTVKRDKIDIARVNGP